MTQCTVEWMLNPLQIEFNLFVHFKGIAKKRRWLFRALDLFFLKNPCQPEIHISLCEIGIYVNISYVSFYVIAFVLRTYCTPYTLYSIQIIPHDQISKKMLQRANMICIKTDPPARRSKFSINWTVGFAAMHLIFHSLLHFVFHKPRIFCPDVKILSKQFEKWH